MKNIVQKATFIGLSMVVGSAMANDVSDQGALYDELRAQMKRACPVVWEDLGASMDTASLNGDVWASSAADKAEFVSLLQEILPSSSTAPDINAMADDLATVATECASHRVALLDALISKTPRDVLLAMDAVNKGMNKSIEYLDGGWSVGDVRVTGRMQAQDGWVFLAGQTIGSAGSAADLSGDDYNELFELAKNWAPNTGTEDWAAGQLVTLPDMRGRTLMAADNMGGSSKNLIASAEADKVGGVLGSTTTALSAGNLPSHSHSITSNGTHTHPTGYAGNHTHLQKASAYGGTSNWGYHDYGGQVQGRTKAENTITKSIQAAGNHKHTMSNAGNHAHTIGNTGSGQPVAIVQPSIVFNVEMKY